MSKLAKSSSAKASRGPDGGLDDDEARDGGGGGAAKIGMGV